MFLSGWRLEPADDALAAPQPRVELPRVQRLDVGHLVGHDLQEEQEEEEIIRVARWQNLIASFPWIAPPRPPPWGNPRKGRDQILPSGDLAAAMGRPH